MPEIHIRKALPAEMDTLMPLYDIARRFMRDTGNYSQWTDGYPTREMIADDIAHGWCYVLTADGVPHTVFTLIPGIDPTYVKIYDGAWQNALPYAALHRIASDGVIPGTGSRCLNWAVEKYGNVRIDTHTDNAVMRHVLEKNGFLYCGRIYIEDGSPRIAFQKTLPEYLPNP